MATTKATPTRKKTRRVLADPNAPFDAAAGLCPQCGAPVHMYAPPDRTIAGPVAYPALLIHFELAHTAYAGGTPQGWPTPPPSPIGDDWETAPPAPEDWVPINKTAAEKGLPQDEGVWPPVFIPERP